jgi:hypothetical protein
MLHRKMGRAASLGGTPTTIGLAPPVTMRETNRRAIRHGVAGRRRRLDHQSLSQLMPQRIE